MRTHIERLPENEGSGTEGSPIENSHRRRDSLERAAPTLPSPMRDAHGGGLVGVARYSPSAGRRRPWVLAQSNASS